MHMVQCYYCNERFDRDKIPTVKVSARRYAHAKCANDHEMNLSQEEQDLVQLEQYIMQLFEEPYVNARIRKQINDFQKEYGYSYSGMLKTLIWWYEVRGNSTEKANGGIGIIPYIYNQALQYYFNLYTIQQANGSKNIKEYIPEVKEIEISAPKVAVKPHKLFDI